MLNSEISVELGKKWTALSEEKKQPFELQADVIKTAHKDLNPVYRYFFFKKKFIMFICILLARIYLYLYMYIYIYIY